MSSIKLDRYSMIIVSNYFNDINDYINISKTCKNYSDIIDSFKFNPIPILVPTIGISY